MDHHQIARLLAAARIAAGIGLTTMPRLAAQVWLGAVVPPGGPTALVRAMGARDVALGYGALRALAQGDDAAPWVEVGAACDAVDGLATVLAMRGPEGIRAGRALPAATVAGAATALGLSAARALRR